MKLRNVVPRIANPRTLLVWLAAGVLCLGLLAHGATKPGVVKTRTGLTHEGEVEQLPNGNVIVTSRAGVVVTIPRDNVASVEYVSKSFLEQFKERRAKLDPSDLKGRLDLARFALEHKEYQLALMMADEAMEIAPSNQDAQTLRETIRQQARLDRAHPPGGDKPPPATAPATNPAATAPASAPSTAPAVLNPFERRFLTPDDIQQIRRAELKPGDSARVAIPNDVRRAYAAQAGVSFAQFSAQPAVEQALEILSKGDDQMRKQVKISSDPEAIVRYKQVQTIVLSGCATTSCHGGAAGGGLVLFPAENDAASYTNFYILSKYARSVNGGGGGGGGSGNGGGFFGGAAEKKLIDRGRGEQSLLIQYGLPETKATHKHPKVANFRPAFRDPNEPNARRIIAWMNDVLKPIEPTYEINYPLPRQKPAAGTPTTGPTTTPAKPE
jgi:hypothetical protein